MTYDSIITDPPYFLSNDGMTCSNGKMTSVNKGSGWDRSKGFSDDYKFHEEWLSLSRNLLNSDGSMWVFGTHHNIFQIGSIVQRLGMKVLNVITWKKPNPPPNLSCRYFTHSTELLIWCAKSAKSKHYFNYSEMKLINGGKQMQSVWEMTAPTPKEKMLGKHPTQKPLKLIERLVLASTLPGQSILDPFNGSGTTGLASLLNNRIYTGIDIDEAYLDLSVRRFNQILKNEELYYNNTEPTR